MWGRNMRLLRVLIAEQQCKQILFSIRPTYLDVTFREAFVMRICADAIIHLH